MPISMKHYYEMMGANKGWKFYSGLHWAVKVLKKQQMQ